MPNSPEHKENSRHRILASAFKLFSTNGYDNISINQIMADAEMTRGAFYGHFENKSVLYREAIFYAAGNSEIVRNKPEKLSDKEWIKKLIQKYLDKNNVTNDCPCPLAALITDVTVREPNVRKAYTRTFKRMNHRIVGYAQTFSNSSSDTVLATTAMIIGGLAIARAVDDPQLSKQLLKSCTIEALRLLDIDNEKQSKP